MFSMSLKSVPGCLVLIAPRLIGVPVAATPGLVPQAEVETVPALPVEVDPEEAEVAAPVAAVVPLPELELELHAASTPSETTATAAAVVRLRQWTDLFMCSAFSWLTASLVFRTDACSALGSAFTSGLAEEDAVHRVHK
jgi:hypothetical protein